MKFVCYGDGTAHPAKKLDCQQAASSQVSGFFHVSDWASA